MNYPHVAHDGVDGTISGDLITSSSPFPFTVTCQFDITAETDSSLSIVDVGACDLVPTDPFSQESFQALKAVLQLTNGGGSVHHSIQGTFGTDPDIATFSASD